MKIEMQTPKRITQEEIEAVKQVIEENLPGGILGEKHNLMKGIGYDIAKSSKLFGAEKDDLIRAVEDWVFRYGSFTSRHKSLLYRVRNEYHISNSSLSYHCEPQTFIDKLLW